VQRLALQVLEHHVGAALELADLVDDDDVLMAAACRGASLEDEALRGVGIRAMQELDGDPAAKARISCKEDSGTSSSSPSTFVGRPAANWE
jgi:hypothetical protein